MTCSGWKRCDSRMAMRYCRLDFVRRRTSLRDGRVLKTEFVARNG